MTKRYVILKMGRLPHRGYSEELYVKGVKAVRNPTVTTASREAMGFMAAKDAYGFATKYGLDDWKVGRR